ncbi:MAG: mediator of RNA polymerase II transcription subunit 31 [archaeon]|nr:mediator of RNA polymerase II transcription subunit 31 [archaeon]
MPDHDAMVGRHGGEGGGTEVEEVEEQAQLVESADDNRDRFVRELEFVQGLSNPAYLRFLSEQGLFEEEAFIAYLKYLLYWKKPTFAQFLMHPQSLALLDLLQHKVFRDSIRDPKFFNILGDQVFWQWKFLNKPSPALSPHQQDPSLSTHHP